jgi:hypothetical protein
VSCLTVSTAPMSESGEGPERCLLKLTGHCQHLSCCMYMHVCLKLGMPALLHNYLRLAMAAAKAGCTHTLLLQSSAATNTDALFPTNLEYGSIVGALTGYGRDPDGPHDRYSISQRALACPCHTITTSNTRASPGRFCWRRSARRHGDIIWPVLGCFVVLHLCGSPRRYDSVLWRSAARHRALTHTYLGRSRWMRPWKACDSSLAWHQGCPAQWHSSAQHRRTSHQL